MRKHNMQITMPPRLRTRILARCLCAVAFVLHAGAALAQVAACAVTFAGTNINFGIYDPFGPSPVTATMSATLTCTHISGGAVKTNWTMALSNGFSGDCAGRQMISGGNKLLYNVYRNNLAGGIWGATCAGDPSGQIQTTNGNPVGSATNILFGQFPTGQSSAAAGSYSDSLVLTITYN